MATTPPALPVTEPPTPLHGANFDLAESSSRSRKGARASKQQNPTNSARTPSPDSQKNSSSLLSTPRRSARNKNASPSSSEPTSSPLASAPSPHKSSSKKSSTKASAAKKQQDNTSLLQVGGPSTSSTAGLPTPIKTPNKKAKARNVVANARELFPADRLLNPEEAMPTPQSRRRGAAAKNNDIFSIGGFTGKGKPLGGIPIYVDSNARVPEVDNSEDNPFVEHSSGAKGKGKAVKKNSRVHDEVQEELKRDKGMYVVFRGKRRFARFEDDDDREPPHGMEEAAQGLGLEDLPSHHFTRASVKPRRLFQEEIDAQKSGKEASSAAVAADEEDDEAPTDIEDGGAAAPQPETPQAHKRKFEIATPPTTVKRGKTTAAATASASSSGSKKRTAGQALLDDSHDVDTTGEPKKQKKKKGPSPFDGWSRTKAGAASSSSAAGGGKVKAGAEKSTKAV